MTKYGMRLISPTSHILITKEINRVGL